MVVKSDHELIQTYAERGCEASFAEVVRRHAGAVYGSALRQLGDSHAAEEVCQTVFILLSRKARMIQPNTVVVGWLMHATRFACKDYKKAEFRRLHRETAAFDLGEDSTDSHGDDASFRDSITPVLDEAVSSLPEKDRNAIWLRFFQNKSLFEVGEALGCAEEAARKRVSRAVGRLQEELKRRGIRTTTEALPGVLVGFQQVELPTNLVENSVRMISSANPHVLSTVDQLSKQLLLATVKSWVLPCGAAMAVLISAAVGFDHFSETRQPVIVNELASDYRPAGFDDARVVHEFIAKLRDAAVGGRAEVVASMCRYPLRVNSSRGTEWIGGSDELVRRFNSVMVPEICSVLLKCPLQGLFCNAQGVMVSDGAIWIAPSTAAGRGGQPEVISVNLPF